MAVKVIQITGEAVTLEEAEAHLRLECDDDIETALIERMIEAASQYCEDYTGRSIREKTLELALDVFPHEIKLPQGPVQSIVSVKYIDRDGVEQTIPATDYSLDDYNDIPWLLPAYGKSWPVTRNQANAVLVRYVAGYDEAPGGLKSAILLGVSDLHANRDGQTEKPLSLNQTVNNLLNMFRISYGV